MTTLNPKVKLDHSTDNNTILPLKSSNHENECVKLGLSAQGQLLDLQLLVRNA